ncbi:MAG: glycosyltransferase family 2 protein [Phycisphaerae bacterium]
MDLDFLVAIPVFDEARYLIPVLDQVREYARDILVIDDGSRDATPELLRQVPDIQVITHPENRGYGKSLADAFAFAMAGEARWLITMDCDEQHEPACIPRFIQAAATEQADIISGTRYPGGTGGNATAPADRRAINATVTDLLNRRLGLRITDAFCGFKAYRVASLARFQITVPGYAMPMQFWVQAVRAGLRIAELPVRLIYNDPTRHFGGMLDDPTVRLAHYLDVLDQELAATGDLPGECGRARVPCSLG